MRQSINPGARRAPLQFAWLVCLFLIPAWGCKREPYTLNTPLNGDIKSSAGQSPQHSFSVDYSSYQKRKALRLHAGQLLDYSIPEIPEGALKFWIKPDRFQPQDSAAILHVKGKNGNPDIAVGLDRSQILFTWKKENSRSSYSTETTLKPGRWLSITIQWGPGSAKSGYQIFVDGISQNPRKIVSSLESHESKTPQGTLRIGLMQNGASDSGSSVQFRDLELVNHLFAEGEVLAMFNRESERRKLVWNSSEMLHFVGSEVPDSEAANGKAWTSDTRIVFSNPVELPRSVDEYQVAFRIKPEKTMFPGTITARVIKDGSTIAERSNDAKDLSEENKYENFIVPFHASGSRISFELNSYAPTKHVFLLDMVTLQNKAGTWKKEWQTEELRRFMGALQDDPDASGGKAVGNDSTLYYGPYVCLGQPGRYRVTWRVKIAQNLQDKAPVVLLDLFSHDGFFPGGRRGHKRYETLTLTTSRFQKRDTWESHSIDFKYDGCDMMEFRAFARQLTAGEVLLDTVIVEPL